MAINIVIPVAAPSTRPHRPRVERPAQVTEPKRSVHEEIADRVLAVMAQGRVPWKRPWKGHGGMPMNAMSGKEYRGVNVLLLHPVVTQMEPIYTTFKAALEADMPVRKGERGTRIVFWKFFKKSEDAEDGESVDQDDTRPRCMCKWYTVFSLDQLEPGEALDKMKAKWTVDLTGEAPEPIAAAEALWEAWANKPPVDWGGGRAYYRPQTDRIGMPDKVRFESPEGLYETLFHEGAHATGHPSRLHRENGDKFGDETYSKEELVAEMAAGFLCQRVGIDCGPSSDIYLANWAARIKADKKLLVSAASQAQKAYDYIIGKEVTP